MLKPYVRGKTIDFREIQPADAAFVVGLRTDPHLGRHLSATPADISRQQAYIQAYQDSGTDYYFIIIDKVGQPLGTIRIYDIQGDSFCWGSWIIAPQAPLSTAIESALLIYDFAFFSLHYAQAHFDVRKANSRVVEFHRRFGAQVVREDEANLYFAYARANYLAIRSKYHRYFP